MTSSQSLALIFSAGVFATFNPCGFAMLPAYLTMLISSAPQEMSPIKIALRALQSAALMALGVISIFAIFGTLIFPISTSIQAYLPIITISIGAILIYLGIASLAGKAPVLRKLWSPNVAPSSNVKSLYLYGVTFALGSISCTIGPLLAATSSSLNLGFVKTLRAYLFYALGISATITVIALLALYSQAALLRVKRSLRTIELVSSIFLTLVGIYLIIFGIYETQYASLIQPFRGVIDGVFSIQGKFISWINSLLMTLGIL
jgi:cytochrome c biogenesis protein CcdA